MNTSGLITAFTKQDSKKIAILSFTIRIQTIQARMHYGHRWPTTHGYGWEAALFYMQMET